MKRSLNLASIETRSRLALRRVLRFWAGAWLLLLAALGAVAAMQWLSVERAARAAEQIERRQPSLNALKLRSAQLKNQFRALQNGQSLIAQLEPEQLGFQVLAAVSASARRCGGRIQLQQLSLSRTRPAPAAADAAADAGGQSEPGNAQGGPVDSEPSAEIAMVTLKGIAIDNLAIARFVADLRDGQLFERVELRWAMEAAETRGMGRSFVIECTL